MLIHIFVLNSKINSRATYYRTQFSLTPWPESGTILFHGRYIPPIIFLISGQTFLTFQTLKKSWIKIDSSISHHVEGHFQTIQNEIVNLLISDCTWHSFTVGMMKSEPQSIYFYLYKPIILRSIKLAEWRFPSRDKNGDVTLNEWNSIGDVWFSSFFSYLFSPCCFGGGR